MTAPPDFHVFVLHQSLFLVEAIAQPVPKNPLGLPEIIRKGLSDATGMASGGHMALERWIPSSLYLKGDSSGMVEDTLARDELAMGSHSSCGRCSHGVPERESRVSEICWKPFAFGSGVTLVLQVGKPGTQAWLLRGEKGTLCMPREERQWTLEGTLGK